MTFPNKQRFEMLHHSKVTVWPGSAVEQIVETMTMEMYIDLQSID